MIKINNIVYDDLMLGDLIFVSEQKGISASFNKQFQLAFSKGKKPDHFVPTHVAIATGESYLTIHSTKSGVHFSSIASYLEKKRYYPDLLVYRNIALEKLVKSNYQIRPHLSETLLRHWGAKYNLIGAGLRKPIEGRMFCSELAMDFFQNIGIIPKNKKAATVYPNDLLIRCQDTEEWRQINPSFKVLASKTYYKNLYNNLYHSNLSQKEKDFYEKKLKADIESVDLLLESQRNMARLSNYHIRNLKKLDEINAILDEQKKYMSEIVSGVNEIILKMRNKEV